MGKERKGLAPADQHRKDERKKELKKLKKQRDERKEAQYAADPVALQREIDRLRGLDTLRAEAGTNAKLKQKIEQLSEVKREAERRRSEAAADPEFAPPSGSSGFIDMSAITGVKRKHDAAAPSTSSSAAMPMTDVGSSSAQPQLPTKPAAQQAAELALEECL